MMKEQGPRKSAPDGGAVLKVLSGVAAAVFFFVAAGSLSNPDTSQPMRFFLYGMGALAISLAIPQSNKWD